MSEDRQASSKQARVLRRELTPKQHKAFSIAKRSAKKVLRRRLRLFRILERGYRKLAARPAALKDLATDFGTMLRLVRTWARREYRSVPWRSVLYALGAVIYFVNPVDLIPDALVAIGFVDDIAVVGAVVKAIQVDLEQFREWEHARLPE